MNFQNLTNFLILSDSGQQYCSLFNSGRQLSWYEVSLVDVPCFGGVGL